MKHGFSKTDVYEMTINEMIHFYQEVNLCNEVEFGQLLSATLIGTRGDGKYVDEIISKINSKIEE